METQKIIDVMTDSLNKEAFPCVVVSVRSDSGQGFTKAMGYQDPKGDGKDGAPLGVKASVSSVFDMASLTKVLATSLLVFKAVDQGLLDFDEPLAKYLPESRCASAFMPTIRQVMSHTAGFPAVTALQRFFSPENLDREAVIKQVFSTEPERKPGEAVVYSCTGFILLGLTLEKLGQARLSELFRREIAVPLGLSDGNGLIKPDAIALEKDLPPIATFLPEPALARFCVPTEFCKWRNRRIRGEVHDESSYCLGGDAGNAGLFANIGGVEKLFDVWKDGGKLIKPETIAEAKKLATPGFQNDQRGLGLLLHEKDTSDGILWPSCSYGHSGFTGTYAWRTPSYKGHPGVSVISLTNRVYKDRDTTASGILKFRRALHMAVAKEFGFDGD